MTSATKLIIGVYGGAIISVLIALGLRSIGSRFFLFVFVPLSFLFLMVALVYALRLASQDLVRQPHLRTFANIGVAIAGLIGLAAGGWLSVWFVIRFGPMFIPCPC